MRKALSGQAIVPIALLGLVSLIGALVWHARRMEADHRATAESALRDYAALAAWQYTQRAENYVSSAAMLTVHNVNPYLHRADNRPLPGPDTLVHFGDAGACGIAPSARFSFRVDLPARTITVAGEAPDSATQRAIAKRFATIAGDTVLDHDVTRMFVDTVGGAPRVIAYGIVRGADSVPRAVFGVEAAPASILSYLRSIPKDKPLLPPSLVRGQPMDSLMTVEVRRADGGVLTTIGEVAPGDDRLAAEERASDAAGALVTRVVMRPQAASLLLIGGLPSSNLDMLLVLLLGSIALAGLALVQMRRGRELARLRTRFVANVSHELRTPLAQISMFSETLLLGRERSDAERQEFLSIIFREARRLSNLVEGVMRFSRADAGAPAIRTLRLEERDVGHEVRDAVRAFTPLAAAAGVELELHADEGAIARVEPAALRQILVNLLDNAVKFGPAGQTITVATRRLNGDVFVSVADEGPGIPRGERTKVFKPFAQGSSGQHSTSTGAGIGLAVVADLVAAHGSGARVWIDDAGGVEGTGARVSIALPAVRQEIDVAPPRLDVESAVGEVAATA